MPLDAFSAQIVDHLNENQPNEDWFCQPHFPPNNPWWVRIYRSWWTHQWPPVGADDHARSYPILWFELRAHEHGEPPHHIYVPIDEKGINFGDVEFVSIGADNDQFLPQPDKYSEALVLFSQQYVSNPHPWQANLARSIEEYLADREYHQSANGFFFPLGHPRHEVDSLIIHDETLQSVMLCLQYVQQRAPMIDAIMDAG